MGIEDMPVANQELLALLGGAKAGNKKLSGLLGNLDNPLLLAFAGVLDPMYGTGSAGSTPLMSQYANSQEPIIQDIVSKVQQGVDPYALSSYIDTLVNVPNTDMAGFQVNDLKGLAKGLANEWSKSSSNSNNVFAKAGFRHPNDVYTYADLPMEDYAVKAIQDISKQEQEATKGYDAAAQNARKALLAFQQGPKSTAPKVRDMGREAQIKKMIKDEMGSPIFLVQDNTLGAFKNWFEKNPQATIGQMEGKYNELARSMGVQGSDFGKVLKKIKQTSKSSERVGPVADTSLQAYDEAQRAKIAPEAAMSNARRIQQAIMDKQMEKVSSKGRTPFTDQVQALMKFVGQS